MEWLIDHIEFIVVVVTFSGLIAVNFNQTKNVIKDVEDLKTQSAKKVDLENLAGHLHEHITRLEKDIRENEKSVMVLIDKLFSEIKDMRSEMRIEMKDGFNKLNDRIFDLLAAEVDKNRNKIT